MTPSTLSVLADAAYNGDRVALVRVDGKEFSGVPVRDRHRHFVFQIRTGRRGRPALIHVDDVVTVVAVEETTG